MTVSLAWALRLVIPPCRCGILEQMPLECPWGPNDYETQLLVHYVCHSKVINKV